MSIEDAEGFLMPLGDPAAQAGAAGSAGAVAQGGSRTGPAGTTQVYLGMARGEGPQGLCCAAHMRASPALQQH